MALPFPSDPETWFLDAGWKKDLFAQFSKARGWPEACADPLFFPSGLFLPDKIPHFLPKTFLLYYKIAKTANF